MERLSRKFVGWFLSKSEKLDEKIYGERKRKLFRKIKGSVLEIGPGTGVNLRYYPKDIDWTGIEPNQGMQKFLKEKARNLGIKIKLRKLKAEKLPLENNSVDFIVSTLVLCSVDNPERVLSEIKRVLKKRGKFLFIEHIASKPKTLRRFFQNLAPHTPWKLFSDNCRPNRETWKTIEDAGFKKINTEYFKVDKFRFNPLTFLINPHIIGVAEK